MENFLRCHSIPFDDITTEFCTCHVNCAVLACSKFCSDHFIIFCLIPKCNLNGENVSEMPTSSICIFCKEIFLVPHFPITVPAHSPASCYCAVIVSSGYICFEIITAQVTQVIQLNILLVNCMPSGSFNGKLRPWAWSAPIQVSLQQKMTRELWKSFLNCLEDVMKPHQLFWIIQSYQWKHIWALC